MTKKCWFGEGYSKIATISLGEAVCHHNRPSNSKISPGVENYHAFTSKMATENYGI
jgi:hypothetical protein